MIRALVIGVSVILLLSSCDRGVLVSEKWSWKDHQWIHGDQKTMVMEAKDTTTVYALDVILRHDDNYPYQNLYVRTVTTYPSGKQVASVVSLELLDDEGKWTGDLGEKCCKAELPLQQRFTFPEIGTYTWKIEPYMRVDTVPAIRSLTVKCREVKE